MSQKLHFVRHSQTRIDPTRSSHEWELTELGRQRCDVLAHQLPADRITALVSSPEQKTRATAAPVADHLGLEVEALDGLREMERSDEPVTTAEEFERSIQGVFDCPDVVVYGSESAEDALARFTEAIDRALARHQTGDIVVFTHGTVLSLFIAAHNSDVDGFEIWGRLGMPALVTVSVPDFQLVDIRAQVG